MTNALTVKITGGITTQGTNVKEQKKRVMSFQKERYPIMTGAIEFLRKAKAICDGRENHCFNENGACVLYAYCAKGKIVTDEADLVRKVMAYQLKEDTQ